jgi:hypothetical protein
MAGFSIIPQNAFTMSQTIQLKENFSPGSGFAFSPSGVIGSSMLVLTGIILLLVWIINYAVPLNAGSLIDLLLLFAAISFGLDYLRGRSALDRRPNWDHRPPSAFRRRMTLAGRKIRNPFGGSSNDIAGKEDKAQSAREQA